ncbi:hypothetical protein S1OALGB6SA_519 [Olavius algarvensis spirochete endosymbiont]|nr:hypothetical protein S1OALGB6SA_519 [Olavius algarvensis spirochete endosymbiont]
MSHPPGLSEAGMDNPLWAHQAKELPDGPILSIRHICKALNR